MSLSRETLEQGIAGLREALQADGADLKVEAIEDGMVTIRLLTGPETCEECILPAEHLEQVLLTAVRGVAPAVAGVRLIDPRTGD